jgi:hypothetical protein
MHIDAIPIAYVEDRLQQEQEKRKQQKEAAEAQVKAAQQPKSTAPSRNSSSSTLPTSALSSAFHAPIAQPSSSSVLASIFQGLAPLARSRTMSPASSCAPTRSHTPAAQNRNPKDEACGKKKEEEFDLVG